MAGFGTGIGLQGQPALHGNYFNQRQQQEQGRLDAKIKRDDDAYQRILEETVIKPGEFHWKVETKAREAVADFTYQVNKLRQEEPNTWENKVPQLKADAFGKVQGYRSDSAALKNIDDAEKSGKYYVPDQLKKYKDTNQGDMKGGLPDKVTRFLYGVTVDDSTGHIRFNGVERINTQEEIEKRVTSKEKAYQYEIDPTTGQPKVNVVRGVDGAMRQYTKRSLPSEQLDETYIELTKNPHFAQNVNIAYAEELMKRLDYNESMIVTQDGKPNPEFLKGATKYGREMVGRVAKPYFTTENLSAPAKNVTNINNQINTDKEKARTVSAIAPQKINVTRKGVQVQEKDENGNPTKDEKGNPIMVDSEELVEISSPAQFTTAPFKGFLAVSPSTYDLQTNEKVDKAGVDKAEYATFAVVPIRNGAMVPYGNDKGSKYKTLEEAIKKGEVEWKVVGIGTYEEGSGTDAEQRTIYRDAEELIGAADAPLTEAEKKDFKRNIGELQAMADKYNSGGIPVPSQSGSPTKTAGYIPGSAAPTKTSGGTLQDRKGNPNGTTIGGKTFKSR